MYNSSRPPRPSPAARHAALGAPALSTSGLTIREAEIFADLHTAIVEQRVLPGMRLTEEELAAIYQASRTRIRRVLLALAHAGVIALSPGRGAQVACPTAEEAKAVFQARRLIEAGLLEAQDAPLSRQALRALRAIQRDEDDATRARDRAAMIRLSGAFHIELARVRGNPVIADIISSLVSRSSLIIALFQRSGAVCCRLDDHASLIEAISAGDMVHAAVVMRAHLDGIEAGLDVAVRPSATLDLRSILAMQTGEPKKLTERRLNDFRAI